MAADSQVEDLVRTTMGVQNVSYIGMSSGGCINQNATFETEKGKVFIKLNTEKHATTMFEGEMLGLQEIKNTKTVKVPQPIKVCDHPSGSGSVLFLECLSVRDLGHTQERLGKELAKMHLHNIERLDQAKASTDGAVSTARDKFGFDVPTCCGNNVLDNEWTDNWVTFYTERRLKAMVNKLKDPVVEGLWRDLEPNISNFFTNNGVPIPVYPSLLHGDLWAGNSAEVGNTPVVFDPASFYGHHEFDLAIATMFGGFSGAFYNAYHKLIPKAPKFDQRQKLYQLFHYLNHWDQFGSGYRTRSIELLQALVTLVPRKRSQTFPVQ